MRLAIYGFGEVGSAVAQLANKYGHTVTTIADSQGAAIESDGLDVESILKQKEQVGKVGEQDSVDALTGPYDVLVEVTPITLGDAEPAFTNVKTALEQDRHVVLGNKSPLAERFEDIKTVERKSEGEVRFEGTVGSVIPVLSTIRDINPAHVTGVRGVFNGTANFILSRMAVEELGFEHVLAEAKDLGVAEEDSSLDVNGTDSALTCSIVANILNQEKEFTLDEVSVDGIEQISGSVLELARENGRTVRLIGEITETKLQVAPRIIPETSPLAVTGSQIVVQIETEDAGNLNLSGSIASGSEMATAILADVNRLGK